MELSEPLKIQHLVPCVETKALGNVGLHSLCLPFKSGMKHIYG